MKNVLQQFEIEILNLPEKKVAYEFDIDDNFFQALDQQLLSKGKLDVKITLEKTALLIKANFEIIGHVELICDRTLNPFLHQINSSHLLVYKFSDHYEELTDEIILIEEHTPALQMAQIIFDYIALNIPLKKIHPDFITEEDKISEENILVYTSVNDDNELTDNNINILDPRWEALKKLKDTF